MAIADYIFNVSTNNRLWGHRNQEGKSRVSVRKSVGVTPGTERMKLARWTVTCRG